MTLKTVLFLLLKGALCGLGEEIQTQNCNIYNIHKRMIQTRHFFLSWRQRELNYLGCLSTKMYNVDLYPHNGTFPRKLNSAPLMV